MVSRAPRFPSAMTYRARRRPFRFAALALLLGAPLFRVLRARRPAVRRVFRLRLLTVRRAALPAARSISGEERRIFERPLSRTLAVESSTTPVAALAAAPSASPATVRT